MRPGELYRVAEPGDDPRRFRVFVVVSRHELINSKFATVVCAPVFSRREGLNTQVPVGVDEGLKHPSWIFCDNLVSIRKAKLRNFVGTLSPNKIAELNRALVMALDLL
jgi:mRNA interferase MazF